MNNADPDQSLQTVDSDLGLLYLLRPVCLNTLGEYGTYTFVYLGIFFFFCTFVLKA